MIFFIFIFIFCSLISQIICLRWRFLAVLTHKAHTIQAGSFGACMHSSCARASPTPACVPVGVMWYACVFQIYMSYQVCSEWRLHVVVRSDPRPSSGIYIGMKMAAMRCGKGGRLKGWGKVRRSKGRWRRQWRRRLGHALEIGFLMTHQVWKMTVPDVFHLFVFSGGRWIFPSWLYLSIINSVHHLCVRLEVSLPSLTAVGTAPAQQYPLPLK